MSYSIFFAWQSQNRETQKYIKKELIRSQQELKTEGMEIKIIFSPTQDETGSPDINNTIIEQIKECDIFIGDLSFVDYDNCVSNENVLYESGIADAFLGEERVILICDQNTVIENIAFDINHRRISRFNTQQKSSIKEWIRLALMEADRQRYIKTYATNQYEDELLTLINYFYRYINIENKRYTDFCVPSLDDISQRIGNVKFPVFFLKTDFRGFIEQLEEKLLRLNQFSHKRVVWNVINIITKLKEYQKFCTQTRYSYINISETEKEQYNIYGAENFYLKSMGDFSFDHKTVLFLKDSKILIGKNGMFVMDERIFTDDIQNYKEEDITMNNGMQKVIVGKLATISEDAIPMISSLVFNILTSIEEYINYCNLSITLEADTLLTIK